MSTVLDALRCYRGTPFGAQLHVAVRRVSCPFGRVAAAVPVQGRILDIGCGHGLFTVLLGLGSSRRKVMGCDVDEHKIDVARSAAAVAAGRGADIGFEVAVGGRVPPGPWDAIALVDVLYLLTHEAGAGLVAAAAAQLAPGGTLVVKDMAGAPVWKATWNRWQETLSVKLLRITRGDVLTFPPPALVRRWLEDAGLELVESARLDLGYPHPHHLLVARKPV